MIDVPRGRSRTRELLDAMVARVGDEEVATRVQCDTPRIVELAAAAAHDTPRVRKPPVLVNRWMRLAGRSAT